MFSVFSQQTKEVASQKKVSNTNVLQQHRPDNVNTPKDRLTEVGHFLKNNVI